MADLVEVLVSSDNTDQFYTNAVWDPKTGNQLMGYRGGSAAKSNTIALINFNFLMSANASKPLIHIWPINSQEQVQSARLVTPGKVNALAVSGDGNYCVCGIAELLYLWHIPTGKMFASLSRHFQNVSHLLFTDDDSHFVSAGQDGMILVWSLADVLSGNQQPRFTFSDHSLPITGLKMGLGGSRATLYSISLDRTVRLYDLAQGQQTAVLLFRSGLTAIAVDRLETSIYVGTTEGEVICFGIGTPPRSLEYHLEEHDMNHTFRGHTGHVTCISLSMDGETVISGGQDGNLLIWHIKSKQILKTIKHKGAVTNAFFTITPPNMFNSEIKLQLHTSPFQRILESLDTLADVPIRVVTKEPMKRSKAVLRTSSSNAPTKKKAEQEEIQRLRMQVKALQESNEKLFKHAVEQKIK